MPLLLDTTVLIDTLRGRPAAERLLALRESGEVPYVCVINVEEVARGLRPRERSSSRALLAALRLAPLGVREGWRAGEWRRAYAESGITLGQADCLIAAAAYGVGARVATGNPRHFPMTEVAVEHWGVGR